MMCHQRDTEVVPSGWMVYERVFDPTLSGTRSAIYIQEEEEENSILV